MVVKNDGYVDFDHSPLPLEIARRKSGKKSVAQICQEQLKRRPWKDITKHDEPSDPEPVEEPAVDDEGRPIKKKRKGRKKKTGDVYNCHVCFHKDYTYKLAFCSTPGCGDAYCYGVLYRAFDLLPQAVMQNEQWRCPKCLGICNCAACRRSKRCEPYMPKNTLLGHDTRPIADDRSVETLVDFRVHNLSWLKNVGEEGRNPQSKRMQRLQEVADAEKAKNDELVNALPALPEGEDESGLEVVRQALANGYGDQMDIVGPSMMGEQEVAGQVGQDAQQQQGDGQQAGPAPQADMSLVEDDSVYPEPSTYPDPRMLGMGYYEQDDTPDKILFDPYQVPSPNAIEEEPEVSEFVKKALRAAKRRARQEEDNDPDFVASKSHHKKRARTDNDGQQEALNNMDPALFDQDMTMPDADMGEADLLQQLQENPEPAPIQGDAPAEQVEEVDDGLPFSINRPALRHAKPKIAYADADKDEDEFDEVLEPKPKPPAPKPAADTAPIDPLDAAAAAVRAITGGGSQTATPAPAVPKKRGPGRPPGRPRKSDATVASTSTPLSSAKKTSTPQPTTGRRSGRPTRSSLTVEVEPSSEEENDIDAQLAAQLDAFDDDGDFVDRASSSRPKDSTPATGPRKRGRPPKNPNAKQQQQQPRTTVAVHVRSTRQRREDSPETPVDMRFLSMKERMALKGKKIKIAARKKVDDGTGSADKGSGSAGSTPGGGARKEDADTGARGSRAGTASVSRPGTATAPAEKGKEVDVDADAQVEDDDFVPGAEEEPVSSPVGSSPGYNDGPEEEEEESDEPEPPAKLLRPAPRSAPSPAKHAGPTIVRLGDSDEESGDGYDEQASEQSDGGATEVSSSSEFDDDEAIPAHKPVRGMSTATRGGRGRGRGRPAVARGRFARRGGG
jgi:hypothetical protein